MSENSPAAMYDVKADIWSTGIMAIEISDKSPPLSDIHPMRALHLIPTADPQTLMLRNPSKSTKLFVNFILTCLVKDPKKRPGADEVLKHQWFAKLDHEKCKGMIRSALVEAKEEKLRRSTNPRAVKAQRQSVVPAIVADGNESSDDEDVVDIHQRAPSLEKSHDVTPTITVSAIVPESVHRNETSSAAETPPSTKPTHSSSPFRTSFITGLNPFRRTRSKSEISSDADGDLVNDGPEIYDLNSALNNLAVSSAADSTVAIAPYDIVSLDLQLKIEILCCDFLAVYHRGQDESSSREYQFLLLGTDRGLYIADITRHSTEANVKGADYKYTDNGPRCRPLVPNVRFKQISVLDDYGVIVSLCGKYNHIRSYNLSSIRKLVAHVYGFEQSPQSPDDDDELDAMMPSPLTVVTASPEFWVNDYVKCVDSRESQSFVITRTKQTCYLGVLFSRDIVVFEWAKLPYLRFMKVKQFWLPELPKFFSILHDGSTIVELMVVYEREANHIEFESSKVVEVMVIDTLKSCQPKECLKDKDQYRWVSWLQLPMSGKEEPSAADADAKKVVPSWYNTIKSMKPRSSKDPIPPREFLGTFGTQTLLCNQDGLATTRDKETCAPSFTWNSVPAQMQPKKGEDQLQTAAPSRVFVVPQQVVIGVHKNFIEVRKYSDGTLLQCFRSKNMLKPLSPGAGFDVLERRRGRIYLTAVSKKKKSTTVHWLKENNFDLSQAESLMRRIDKEEKINKVVGTGTFSVNKRV